MPVIGDSAYGGGLTAARRRALGTEGEAAVAALGRHALHAHRLGFRHPASGDELVFESDLPNELKLLENGLKENW
ncbi:MAG: hypothetical protein OXI64_11180 [Defluviicoccus sp.]|nr:hypothetical protein [Defluviicoccus sp.]